MHVKCELEVDLVVFLVDLEEEVGSRGRLLFLVVDFFDHFLS